MKICRVAAISLVCLLLHVPAQAQSPVWKITKGDNHLFIGGTIHVLGSADYPLPGAFDKAYKKSSVLVLEADLQKIRSPEINRLLVQKGMYQRQEDITGVLKPATVKALREYMNARGIPAERMLSFRPWLLSITLLSMELQRLGQGGTGVDEFYCLKARDEQRPIIFLEELADQLGFLFRMGEGSEDEFIRYTLEDLNDLSGTLQAIKDAWRAGDAERLQKVAVDPLQKEFPDLYATLLVERNNNWIKNIQAMLATKDVELVLVGSLHLVGSAGIIEQLKQRGCVVENM